MSTGRSRSRHGAKKGNFADSRNGLLTLFADPDGRGERSWRETFGYERRAEKPRRGQPFIARELPRSSSDS
jgi:hypothetical protein